MRPRRVYLSVACVIPLAVGASAGATSQPVAPADWRVTSEQPIEVDGRLGPLSPDGQSIAGIGPDGEFCVWKVATEEPTCAGESLPIPDPVLTTTMVWAPDSSAVAFDLDFARRLIDSDIYVYDVATTTLTDLTDDDYSDSVLLGDDAPEPAIIDIHPAWSPDGSELLFTRLVDSEQARTTTLMRIDRTGGNATEVLQVDADAPFPIITPPRWLADDTVLYVYLDQDLDNPDNGIWRTDIEGREPVQIVAGSSTSDIVGAVIASVGGNALSIYSYRLRSQYTVDGDVVFWLGDVDGNLAPLTAYDFDAGAPLPSDAPSSAQLAAGVGRPITSAAITPDGAAALVGYRLRSSFRIATVDVQSGAVTPLAVTTPLERISGVEWVDGGGFVRTEPGAGVVLTLQQS